MALYDSADLLAKCQLQARVPASTNFPTAAQWYSWLSDAQVAVKNDLAVEVPMAMMNAPALMTSADGGYTYTFGTDAGSNPIFPIGKVEIFRTLYDIPSNPYTPGLDYLMEGTQIRWVNKQTQPAPYGRWVTPPYLISASVEPSLPLMARPLLVFLACSYYASAGGEQDPGPYQSQYSFHRNMVVTGFKKQFMNQGAAAALGRRRFQLPYVRG